MQFARLFSTTEAKGKENYLSTQKYYEIARTVLYFVISLALFVAGWIQTGSRTNLLTIVAILGCLPACKSLVTTIMYLRYSGCKKEDCEVIKQHNNGLSELYDCIFTSYKINFIVDHLVVKGSVICGYSSDASFDENEFYHHINDILTLDGHKDMTVKIFKNLNRYTERLDQLCDLTASSDKNAAILETLKSVML